MPKLNRSNDPAEFDTFLELIDTPDSYSGDANKFVRVNAGENALDFVKSYEIGEFSVSGEVIAGSGSYTIEITLSETGYSFGILAVYLPVSVANTTNRRRTSLIMFTTDINNALARSGGKDTYTVYGYNITDNWIKGFKYVDDSKLSEGDFAAGVLGSVNVRIESCYIDGDKIKLTFRNGTAGNATLTCKGNYYVFK
jgi:hypothetical protein